MAVTFVVPGAHLMSGLLGERDEHLRFIEGEFEDVAIRVRGNEVSISGPQSDVVSRYLKNSPHCCSVVNHSIGLCFHVQS